MEAELSELLLAQPPSLSAIEDGCYRYHDLNGKEKEDSKLAARQRQPGRGLLLGPRAVVSLATSTTTRQQYCLL